MQQNEIKSKLLWKLKFDEDKSESEVETMQQDEIESKLLWKWKFYEGDATGPYWVCNLFMR